MRVVLAAAEVWPLDHAVACGEAPGAVAAQGLEGEAEDDAEHRHQEYQCADLLGIEGGVGGGLLLPNAGTMAAAGGGCGEGASTVRACFQGHGY